MEEIGVDLSRLESQTVYAAIIDSGIYKKHKEFFKKYHFCNELIGKLANVVTEAYENGNGDIMIILDRFVCKYGVDRSKMKVTLVNGIKSVMSLESAEQAIAKLVKCQTPEGHTTGADGNA